MAFKAQKLIKHLLYEKRSDILGAFLTVLNKDRFCSSFLLLSSSFSSSSSSFLNCELQIAVGTARIDLALAVEVRQGHDARKKLVFMVCTHQCGYFTLVNHPISWSFPQRLGVAGNLRTLGRAAAELLPEHLGMCQAVVTVTSW